jgi:hypothetical protein
MKMEEFYSTKMIILQLSLHCLASCDLNDVVFSRVMCFQLIPKVGSLGIQITFHGHELLIFDLFFHLIADAHIIEWKVRCFFPCQAFNFR